MIGGLIIVVGSLVFTMVVFPDYFRELATVQEQQLRAAGRPEPEIRQMMEMTAKTSTPAMQALFGFLGTLITGVVVSAIIGAFVRAKRA